MKLEEELETIKDQLDIIKTKKIEISTRLKGLEDEKLSLLSECKKLNIDPKHIDQIIAEHEKTINQELSLLKNQLEQFSVLRNNGTVQQVK